MTSLIANNKNPFLKDYSQATLLKRNYDLIKGYNQQLKQNKIPYQPEISHSKEKFYVPSVTSNPFHKKSLNALDLMHQKRNNNDLQLSQARSLSHSRNVLGNSVEKGSFYRGLEDIGTKQLWKTQLQKQCRYQLKHYGPQTLRYQYHPLLENYNNKINNQQPVHISINPPSNITKHNKTNHSNKSSKLTQKSVQQTKKTPSFNKNIATLEYYGYEQNKQNSSDDDFYIQKSTRNKQQQNKRGSTFGIINEKNILRNNKHSQRRSYYEEIIPQDRNQDLQTLHNLNKNNNNNYNIYKRQQPDNNSRRQNNSSIHEPKRTSIQQIYSNYSNYHNQQSILSSGHGAPSQMYESGANFYKSKFNNLNSHHSNNNNKQGPLCIKKAFNDQKDDQKSQQWQNDQSISKSNYDDQHPQKLQYNNKIYYMISLL